MMHCCCSQRAADIREKYIKTLKNPLMLKYKAFRGHRIRPDNLPEKAVL
jgi:hypothetical protein